MTLRTYRRMRCPSVRDESGEPCNAPLHIEGIGITRRHRCERGHLHNDEWLAANHAGPWAPERTERPAPESIPGFAWAGTHYVRIKSQDTIDDEMRRPMRFGGSGAAHPDYGKKR
jgi:hypothetical protein